MGPNKTLNSPVREESEIEPIQELSKKTLGRYLSKAGAEAKWHGVAAGTPQTGDWQEKAHRRATNRVKGITRVGLKLTKEESEITEVSNSLKRQYLNKVDGSGPSSLHSLSHGANSDPAARKKLYNRADIADKTERRLKETAEPIQEVSKKLLGRYIYKASDDRARAVADMKNASANQDFPKHLNAAVRNHKRRVGIEDALRRLTKEDTVSEARLLHSYDSADGRRSAKVYRDNEWDDHVVKYYKNGVHQKNADSHHYDDKEDAHSSAKHFVKESAQAASHLTPMRTKPKTDVDFLKPKKTTVQWGDRNKRSPQRIGEGTTVRTADAREIPVRDRVGKMTWRKIKNEIRVGDQMLKSKDTYTDPYLKEDFETWSRVNARRSDTLLRHTHLYKSDRDRGAEKSRKDLRQHYKKMGLPPVIYPYKTSDSLKESDLQEISVQAHSNYTQAAVRHAKAGTRTFKHRFLKKSQDAMNAHWRAETDRKNREPLKHEPKVHDLRHMSHGAAYDHTQTSEHVRDGDVLHLKGGHTAVMNRAWPVMVTGDSKEMHHLEHGHTWDEHDGGKYKKSVALAHKTAGLKESTEITEVSKKLVGRYLQKAANDLRRNTYTLAQNNAYNLVHGRATVGNPRGTPANPYSPDEKETISLVKRRQNGINRAGRMLTKESTEITEVSKKLLGRYVKAAATDQIDNGYRWKEQGHRAFRPQYKSQSLYDTVAKRNKYISKAVDRLTEAVGDHPAVLKLHHESGVYFTQLKPGYNWSGQHGFGTDTKGEAAKLLKQVTKCDHNCDSCADNRR
jgi:hypothetical protein